MDPLFDDSALEPATVPVRPLFEGASGSVVLSQNKAEPAIVPLFENDPVPAATQRGVGLFSSTPAPSLVAQLASPILPPTELPPLQAPKPIVAAPAFAADLDPLAEKAWHMLLQQYPHASDSSKAHWRARLQALFPLSADRLSLIGKSAVERMPFVMTEVAQSGEKLSRLEPAKVLARIGDSAQAAASGKSRSGLLSRMETLLHTFNPETAHQELILLQSQLQGLSNRLSPVRDLVQEVLAVLADDMPLIALLADLAKSSPIGSLVVRRQEMLQASQQQLQMALKQLELLNQQVANALQSNDELRTVTLPALGFVRSLR